MNELFADRLLDWYDRCQRQFVFRGTHDPYRVWLSEIMLQQTRTESVGTYYERFLDQFPDVASLAAADEEAVLRCWQGLGYYSRARNLHKAAQTIVAQYRGRFPGTAAELSRLPGIGAYTAAAIASIAFQEPVPAMDGNLIRVFARYLDDAGDIAERDTIARLTDEACRQISQSRPGDFNQALMDLGATVCTPGTPDCDRCPISEGCQAFHSGQAENRPVSRKKNAQKVIFLNVLVIFWRDRVFMKIREEALLHGMYVFPVSESEPDKALAALGMPGRTPVYGGEARHVFTHRIWEMKLWKVRADTVPDVLKPHFYQLSDLDRLPIPVAMKAACAIAREELSHEERKSPV